MNRSASIRRKQLRVLYLTCLLKLKSAHVSKYSIWPRKRLPVTFGLFLTGIVIAAIISSIIGTPQIKTDYLHEHLKTLEANSHIRWAPSEFDLGEQDKFKIEQLILRAEKTASLKAFDDNCIETQKRCGFPLRINRKLTAAHINRDFRVANIIETSLRVDLKTSPENDDLLLNDIFEESRVLRFSQTQSGWIENGAQLIEQKPQSVASRSGKFRREFSQKFVGLNYYPATASWRDFWVKFPIYEITSDLIAARDMNVNAVRIFLNHDYFDDANTQDEAIAKLTRFLDLCEDYNIQVLITLFDLRPNYELSNWSADINHINAVLTPIATHPAILGVDLKNQPDLDFEVWGAGRVEAWLTVMARHIQTKFPKLAVTAGWSTAENALRLKDVIDVVTYHEYQNPKGFKDRLSSIKAAAKGKPVMITELGSTTWHPPFIQMFTEKNQASRLSKQLTQASLSNGVFVWTLNDFDHVGHDVVGRLPWRQAQQRHFGLIRKDGSLRPAADVLKSFGEHAKTKRTEIDLTHLQPSQETRF